MSRRCLTLLLFALLSFASSCALSPTVAIDWRDDNVDLGWPAAPAQPRIRYLRSLSGAADVSQKGAANGFFDWLSGERSVQYSLLAPFDVTADGAGRIWVTDTLLRSIVFFDLRKQGVTLLTSLSGRSMQAPSGIGYDATLDRLYVADSLQKTVFVLTPEGKLVGERVPTDGYGRPAGIAVDNAGNLYVTDVTRHRVVVFDRDGRQLDVLFGDQPPENTFNRPLFHSTDDQRNLFVVDSMNFRVESFDSSGRSSGTIGEIGDGPGRFSRPRGVAVDSYGHIYVVDASFGNVQVFDQAGRLLTYFGRPGKGAGEFSLPAGIFCDVNDRLYVVDSYNKRIQIFQYLPLDSED